MKNLSQAMYDKAVYFLQHEARLLERALYAYHFEGAPAAIVLRELERFQNADGGFGHGLEPDICLGDSSVIATTIAFQRFREVGAPADHPMVANACRYLLNTYDAERVNWPIIPPNVDDEPHAPWWVHDGDLEKSMNNPRAEIAGYLYDYTTNFPDEMRAAVTRSVLAHLSSQPEQMEMHDLLCYIRFAETPSLPEGTRAALLDKLRRIVDNTVERNPEQWKNYGLPPLAIIASPPRFGTKFSAISIFSWTARTKLGRGDRTGRGATSGRTPGSRRNEIGRAFSRSTTCAGCAPLTASSSAACGVRQLCMNVSDPLRAHCL